MSEASIFHLAVERVLNGWTALQLAVEHGMGGAESAAKATWMVDAIDQWFQENEDIEVDELEDFLANILDAEFDTVADDGSLQEVSSLIRGYFRLCQTGKEVQVQEQISRLPKAKVGQSKQTANDCDGMDEMECDAGPSTSQASRGHRPPEEAATAQSEQTSGISADEDMDAEDDGWTVVKRGTKRR